MYIHYKGVVHSTYEVINYLYSREKSIFKSATCLLSQAAVTNYFSAFLSTAMQVLKTHWLQGDVTAHHLNSYRFIVPPLHPHPIFHVFPKKAL